MSDDEDTRGPRERAYDDELVPLVLQMQAICKRERMSFVAVFALDDDPALGVCASVEEIEDDATAVVRRVARAVMGPRAADEVAPDDEAPAAGSN